jgi:ABC-type xylose transport system permease subunit
MFPFTDKIYLILKWIATIVLPAVVTLILAIGQIWDIPVAAPIALTVGAVNAFLGALIGISTSAYNKSQKEE